MLGARLHGAEGLSVEKPQHPPKGLGLLRPQRTRLTPPYGGSAQAGSIRSTPFAPDTRRRDGGRCQWQARIAMAPAQHAMATLSGSSSPVPAA
jgi:hypothetical protein